jgi:hypothetical protein
MSVRLIPGRTYEFTLIFTVDSKTPGRITATWTAGTHDTNRTVQDQAVTVAAHKLGIDPRRITADSLYLNQQ